MKFVKPVFSHVCQVVSNHSQTLDGTKVQMQVFLAVAGIWGHIHEWLSQTDYAFVGNSDTVSSLLLIPPPSEEV